MADGADAFDAFELQMALSCGPVDDRFTDGQLRRAWQVYGAELIGVSRGGQPGDRAWGFWRFVLGLDDMPSRLERVLILDQRDELTEEERERIKTDAEHARKRVRYHVVITPKAAAESMERSQKLREDEAIEIAEALEAKACG